MLLAKELMACFTGKDAEAERRMGEIITNNQETFAADNMLGLVKRARAHIKWERIRRLTSTYLTLSLST